MWLSTADLREKFNIQASRFETQLEAAITSAGLTIQRSVSSTIYDEAVGTAPDPLTLSYQSVVEAHSYLTMWFLVGNAGNRLSEAGFIKAQQDSASPAINSRIITNSYLTPKEIAEMRAGFLADAKFHLGEYGTIEIEVETVTDSQSSLAMASLQWF